MVSNFTNCPETGRWPSDPDSIPGEEKCRERSSVWDDFSYNSSGIDKDTKDKSITWKIQINI